MPYTVDQHRLFEAAAHDPAIAKSRGIPQAQAATMASEGIKPAPRTRKSTPQQLATALQNMKGRP